jgi:hypothetical protein
MKCNALSNNNIKDWFVLRFILVVVRRKRVTIFVQGALHWMLVRVLHFLCSFEHVMIACIYI